MADKVKGAEIDQLRKNLIELIGRTPCCGFSSVAAVENIADHLIANGATVQPCKVGDTIFEADGEHGVVRHKVYEVCTVYKTTATDDKGAEWDDFYTSEDINTAHKTRAEAEAALLEPSMEG